MLGNSFKKRIQLILEEEEDFMVPLGKIKALLIEELGDEVIATRESLLKEIKDDDHIRVIGTTEDKAWPDNLNASMEALGFYHGPFLMLDSRRPTQTEFMEALAARMQRTINGLKQVYANKPEHLSDKEEDFLALMARTKTLENKLHNIIAQVNQPQEDADL